MRIPIASMKEGFDAEWPITYDSPEEALLIDLFNGGRIDIDTEILGVEDGMLVMNIVRIERPKLTIVKPKKKTA